MTLLILILVSINLVLIGLVYINQRKIMATLVDFQNALAAVDAETTRIADLVQTLLDQLNSGNLSDTQETEVLSQLQAVTDRLRLVGASVENPVPPV